MGVGDGVDGSKPGHCDMEEKLAPFSTTLVDPKEQQSCCNLAPTRSQELPERSRDQRRTASWTPIPDLLVLTPEFFPKEDAYKIAAV